MMNLVEYCIQRAKFFLKTRHGSGGFTLMETMIVLGIISLLVATAAPVYRDFQIRNDIDLAQRIFLSAARKAQQQAQSGDGNRAWGVAYTAAGNITIFRASSDGSSTTTYASRDAAQDDTIVVPSSVTPSGGSPFEIDYRLATGATSNIACPSGSSTLSLTGVNGVVRTVAVNCKGTLTW